MSRLRGQSQNRENQESCPEDPGVVFQRQHFGAAKARPRLIGLLLALITLLAYWPVARNGFVNYDDNDYVMENHVVQKGLTWAGVKWAFTTGYACNWHPVTWLSHMLDCEWFGLNAGAHHSVSLLFHTANAVLVFLLLLRLTRELWPSAFVAALFAWHPLHVESVAWIAERKDVLSTFFALLTLLAYARYAQRRMGENPNAECRMPKEIRNPNDETPDRQRPNSDFGLWASFGIRHSAFDILSCHQSRFYWLALVFFTLGLMAKPMLVTLPFVMLLLDYWPLRRIPDYRFRIPDLKRLTLEKWPFFLLTIISCIVTYLVQHHGEAVIPLQQFPLNLRVENALTAYTHYLLKTIWPVDLAVVYPLFVSIPRFAITISAVVLISISASVWLARRRQPYLLVGWLWFLGTLVPVIGLVQVGIAALADRYTYFPLVGMFIAVAFGVRDLVNRVQFPKAVVTAAAVLVLAGCLILTENQLRCWRDSESLFRHAVAVTKNNNIAHLNLGTICQDAGRLNEALAEYRASAQVAPGYSRVHSNLGSVLDALGLPEEALAEYRLALQLETNFPPLHDGIGIVFVELGHFDEAMSEFSNAARLDPAYPWPYFQMGKALLQQGRDAEAIGKFREALRINPDNFQILAFVAHVLAADEKPGVRDGQTALLYAARANILSAGTQPFVFDALGMACAEAGHFDDAQEVTRKAINLAIAAKMKNLEPMQQRLELYRKHQPWRESFLSTNLPPKDLP